MLIYQYIITGILAFILINFLINISLFKNIKRFSLPGHILSDPPLISVLIPARNEEKNIRRCVSSFMKQDYKNLEVIVLDDNSSDSTASIVNELIKKDPRVKLISGQPLKKGWMGKCWACHQLSQEAKGQYYIFTDADTLHYKNTVSRSFAAMVANNLDGISVYPKQITVTFHERMTVPFIIFAIISFVPLVLLKKTKSPLFSTGIGQFFMFSKQAYEKMGGHKSVKSEILEDIHISKQIKKAGYRYMIFDGSDNVYCRMYTNLNEVSAGFSKVIYAAFDYNAAMEALALTFFSILFLFPFLMLPLGIVIFDWSGHILTHIIIQIFMVLLIKIILAMRFKIRILDSLLMPVSVCYMLVFAVRSYFMARIGKGVYWKGRTYNIDSVEDDELELVDDIFEKQSQN